jgi:hypothetical protein
MFCASSRWLFPVAIIRSSAAAGDCAEAVEAKRPQHAMMIEKFFVISPH